MNRAVADGATEHAVFGSSQHDGGMSGHGFGDRQYGRRVEADHSWTVYHVFSGIPAYIDGTLMTGLTRSSATKSMLDLNRRNADARKEWNEAQLAPDQVEMLRAVRS